jgi:hypothetical protein
MPFEALGLQVVSMDGESAVQAALIKLQREFVHASYQPFFFLRVARFLTQRRAFPLTGPDHGTKMEALQEEL